MHEDEFCVELDGRRVVINPARQEVRVLDAGGHTLSHERIQVAAGSVQGIFSSLHDVVAIPGDSSRRNA